MLNDRISPAETMMDRPLDLYLQVGASALAAIDHIMGQKQAESVLDLPCGHGRVARHLRARFPAADLFVSDLDECGTKFCAETFNAKPLSSRESFDKVDFGRKFDLIWVGSLITHLPKEGTVAFLGFLSRHIAPDGVAVVSSHGPFVAGRLFARNEPLYGLSVEQENKILEIYFERGYGFCRYPHSDSYGISVISKDWLQKHAAEAGLELFSYIDHAWDHHQDVFGLRLK